MAFSRIGVAGIVLYAPATTLPENRIRLMSQPALYSQGPVGVLLGAAAVVIIIGGLKVAAPLVVPFLLAVVLATILIPPLHWMTERKVPLPLAMVIVSLGLVLVWIPLAAIVGASFDAFYVALPEYQQKVEALVLAGSAWLGERGIETGREALEDLVQPAAALSFVRQIGSGLGTALANFFLILLTIIFILLEASSFPDKVREALGGREGVLDTFREFSDRLQDYLRIKTLVSLMTGATIAGWLWLVGLDFHLLWGVLAFLLNYVPNIGSIIAAVPAVLLAMVALDWTGVLLVIAGFVAVNVVFGNIVEPRMMGKGLGMSTLVVFLSLVFWGWVLGPVGMLLSGPLTMAVKIALETDARTRWFAVMLGPSRQAAAAMDSGEQAPEGPGPAPKEE
jgi:AI-2 transport protein TqsA